MDLTNMKSGINTKSNYFDEDIYSLFQKIHPLNYYYMYNIFRYLLRFSERKNSPEFLILSNFEDMVISFGEIKPIFGVLNISKFNENKEAFIKNAIYNLYGNIQNVETKFTLNAHGYFINPKSKKENFLVGYKFIIIFINLKIN